MAPGGAEAELREAVMVLRRLKIKQGRAGCKAWYVVCQGKGEAIAIPYCPSHFLFYSNHFLFLLAIVAQDALS